MTVIIIDADCKLLFPSFKVWDIASIIVDEYKEVLKRMDEKFFIVIYKMITDTDILASEIKFTGLWRPWGGEDINSYS